MDTLKGLKINQLFAIWPPHMIATTSWLNAQGVSSSNRIKRYVRSGWIIRLGPGAFLKSGEPVIWAASIHALQHQLKLDVHIGGESSLELEGLYDQVPQGLGQNIYLYGRQGLKLPKERLNGNF